MDDSPRNEVGRIGHARPRRGWRSPAWIVVFATGLALCITLAAPFHAMAGNAHFWISASNVAPSLPETTPTIVGINGSTRYLHIWARPMPGKVLQNFSLNLVTTHPLVKFDDDSIIVHNPLLDGTKRFHFVNDSIGVDVRE